MESDDEIPTLIERDVAPGPPSPELTGKRVPLTVICGFLGAGKSTLLKRILTERHGYRIAVIMNEFADTAVTRTINVSSVDDPEAQQSEEILELANGCLCCSIKDKGAAAIEKLMQRKGAFDHILLETTGLADPGPIASMFWQNEEYTQGLGSDITLDGVLCVVDAVFGKQQMLEDEAIDGLGESLRQIGGSDVIILNKIDLSSPSLLSETEELIRKVNPAAPLHKTIQAQIDLKHIIGIQAYSSVNSLSNSASASESVGGQNVGSPSASSPGVLSSDSKSKSKEAQFKGLGPASSSGSLASPTSPKQRRGLGEDPEEGGPDSSLESLKDPSLQQERHHGTDIDSVGGHSHDLGNDHVHNHNNGSELRHGHGHDHTHDHDDHAHHEHNHDHSQKHDHVPLTTTHYELRGISSIQVTCPILTPSTLETLEKWIQSVLWENQLPDHADNSSPPLVSAEPSISQPDQSPKLQVLRCKGLFTLINGDQYILQGVRNIYDLSKVESSSPGVQQEPDGDPDNSKGGSNTGNRNDSNSGFGVQEGKIVLIGKGLDRSVRESLERVFGYHR
ncbi:cobW-domain-containing protein [Pluteus cervinus]|uniref:CobW-domain-containing protein n=1 Tax=Pluteus cervinus TaxID=181527 RepID=A0ACD3BAL6_9AGAR|nr:cobW-domain-containing protein [Pluteus cervinus]